MEWKEWKGKKVYIETNSHRRYTGTVVDIDISQNPNLVWITIISTQGNKVTFVHSEIKLIQEEK